MSDTEEESFDQSPSLSDTRNRDLAISNFVLDTRSNVRRPTALGRIADVGRLAVGLRKKSPTPPIQNRQVGHPVSENHGTAIDLIKMLRQDSDESLNGRRQSSRDIETLPEYEELRLHQDITLSSPTSVGTRFPLPFRQTINKGSLTPSIVNRAESLDVGERHTTELRRNSQNPNHERNKQKRKTMASVGVIPGMFRKSSGSLWNVGSPQFVPEDDSGGVDIPEITNKKKVSLSKSIKQGKADTSSTKRPPTLPAFRPRFSGNPTPLMQSGKVIPTGMDDINGVFAFDQIVQFFVFATTDGDIKLCSPDFELRLPNDLTNVSIIHLAVVPGVNRCVSVGIQQLKGDEAPSWPSTSGSNTRVIIQVWDFSQMFPNSSRSIDKFEPITIEVAYQISVLQRVKHHRTMDPARLYYQCKKESEAQFDQTNRQTEFNTRSLSRSPSSSAPSDTCNTQSNQTRRLDISSRYFNHPDSTPFPCGDPSSDSRWLFLVGTFEGDVRLFDSWECQFVDYLITGENVYQQLSNMPRIAPLLTSTFQKQRVTQLPIIKAIVSHPTEPHLILIGYGNGLIVEWNISKHKVTRCYFPSMSQTVIPDPISIAQRSSGAPQTGYLAPGDIPESSREVQQSQQQPVTSTILVPPSLDPPSQPMFLHSLVWHPIGNAFAIVISGIAPTDHGLSFLSHSLMVFSSNRSQPIFILSLEHVIKDALSDFHVPFIFWEHLEKSMRAAGQLNTLLLMKAKLYFLLSPLTPITELEIEACWSWSRHLRINLTSSVSTPTNLRGHARGHTSPRRSICNLWRLSGNMWSDAHPVFPSGLSSSSGASNFLGIASAQLVIPSVQQTPLGFGFPFASNLCGLGFPLDLERDQGEDADTIIEAAKKLTQFLLAGTFVLVLAECPTRKLLGACLKVDREKFVLLSYMHPKIADSLDKSHEDLRSRASFDTEDSSADVNSQRSAKSYTSMTPEGIPKDSVDQSSSSSEEDDFTPWETMRKPVCFQIDWQALAFSQVSCFLSLPRFVLPSNDPLEREPSPALPVYRYNSSGICYYPSSYHAAYSVPTAIEPDVVEARRKRSTDFSASKEINNSAALDTFIDALYTLRKKHHVHGWLNGLLGKEHRLYLASIPRKLDTVGRSTTAWDPRISRSSLRSSPSTDHVRSTSFAQESSEFGGMSFSSDDDAAEDAEEWRTMNEVRYLGDLLRISTSKWGFQSIEVSEYKHISVTGHVDGKIRIWTQTSGGWILLHTLSIVTTRCLFPTNDNKLTDISENVESIDRSDLLTIAAIDAKPVIPCHPDIPIITCLTLYIPGYDPHVGTTQPNISETARYLVAGCISGEVIIFRWSPESLSLPPLETKQLISKSFKKPEKLSYDREDNIITYESTAAKFDSVLPFGFTCISRVMFHTARITALHVVTFEIVDELDNAPKRDRTRAGILKGIGLRARPKTSTTAAIVLEQTKESKLGFHVLIGDSSGLMSCVDLITGRVLSTHMAPSAQSGTPMNRTGSFDSTSAPFMSGSRSIQSFSTLTRPLLGHGRATAKNEAAEVTPNSHHTGNRYVMVVYLVGVIRMFDCFNNRFLDDDGNTRFITRLDTFNLPSRPSTGLSTSQTAGRSLANSSSEEASAIKVILVQELKVDFIDFNKSCQHYIRENPTWPAGSVEESSLDNLPCRTRWSKLDNVKNSEIDSNMCAFVVVTSFWVGVLDYKCVDRSASTIPYTPQHVCGIDLQREAMFASVSFLDNLPIATVHLKGGQIEVFGFHFNSESELSCTFLACSSSLNQLSPLKRAHVLSQLNWTYGDWSGLMSFGRRTADSTGSSFYTSNILQAQNALYVRWRKEAWTRLAQTGTAHSHRSQIRCEGNKRQPYRPSSSVTLAAPSPSSAKRSKGWASSLVNKFSQWAADYAKSSTGTAGIREFVKTAPRECLCTSRDLRLRGREVSWRTVSSIPPRLLPEVMEIGTATEISSRLGYSPTSSIGHTIFSSDCGESPDFGDGHSRSRGSTMSARTEQDFTPSSVKSQPSVGMTMSPSTPTETEKGSRRKKASWISIFGVSALPAAGSLENETRKSAAARNGGTPQTEDIVTAPETKRKIDPWEAAERAKQKMEENLEMTRQTAVKAEEANTNARELLDLSKALTHKYR